jgi:hypothetical protein
MTGFTISISIGTKSAGWAGMIMLIIFFFGFAFGMLPISWLYPSEILPLHMRHVGLGVAGITTWLFTFLTVFTGPISFTETGYKIFILYIIFNALAFPYGESSLRSVNERSGTVTSRQEADNLGL